MSTEKVICGPNDAAFLRDGDSSWSATNGLTKREYFAGLALQGILSNHETAPSAITVNCPVDAIAGSAVEIADALIKALNK